MPRVVITRPARKDLIAAAKYIAEKAGSSAAAVQFLDSVDERLELYDINPQLGEVCHDLNVRFRRFTVSSYVLFYREVGDGIEVVRVLHGSRDISTILGNE
jgi:toxin ParE1/3/4